MHKSKSYKPSEKSNVGWQPIDKAPKDGYYVVRGFGENDPEIMECDAGLWWVMSSEEACDPPEADRILAGPLRVEDMIPKGWQPIATAPRDGTEVLVAVEIATVWIVRNAWYRDAAQLRAEGDLDVSDDETGWWAYRNSVTQEQLDGIYEPTLWMPMPDPTEVGTRRDG